MARCRGQAAPARIAGAPPEIETPTTRQLTTHDTPDPAVTGPEPARRFENVPEG